MPLFPDAAAHYQELMLLIALASILYGSAMAFTANDTRLILGYSSVAQLGFITLGIFSLTPEGAQGGSSSRSTTAWSSSPPSSSSRCWPRARGSEDLRDMGGVAFRAPVLAALFLVVALATLAMPGSSNFVGEFLILLGIFNSQARDRLVAFTGVGLAAVYTLRLFIRAMHNRVGPRASSRARSACATASCSSRSCGHPRLRRLPAGGPGQARARRAKATRRRRARRPPQRELRPAREATP